MSVARVMLGAESLLPGNGGICRVARLMARVMGEDVAAGRYQARAVALSDAKAVDDLAGLPVTARSGRRLRFVADMQMGTLRHSHFVYDFLGMARAHCRVPVIGRPMLVYLHGIEIWEGARPDRVQTARLADALLVNSEYTLRRAEALHGRFPVQPKVCWLATESDDDPALPPDRNGPPTVMILGRIDDGGAGYKGHRELVTVWPSVVSAVPDARLVIVGRGPGFDALRAVASASKAAASIEMKGFVPDEDVERIWTRTTVFAMPSRKEGFGLVYIEAMRQGLPVIASVYDAAPEVNIDGETGYNIDFDADPSALADRIVHLLRDRDAAAAMGRRGYERWRQHFRYSAFRDRFRAAMADFVK